MCYYVMLYLLHNLFNKLYEIKTENHYFGEKIRYDYKPLQLQYMKFLVRKFL